MRKEKRIRGAGGFTKINTERNDFMPREKPSYRDNLERLDNIFPSREMLTVTDVSNFTGVCRRVAKKMFSFNQNNYISKATLAREMS